MAWYLVKYGDNFTFTFYNILKQTEKFRKKL
jgi:hypothetical protein